VRKKEKTVGDMRIAFGGRRISVKEFISRFGFGVVDHAVERARERWPERYGLLDTEDVREKLALTIKEAWDKREWVDGTYRDAPSRRLVVDGAAFMFGNMTGDWQVTTVVPDDNKGPFVPGTVMGPRPRFRRATERCR
jgi:hypothetical protein